MPIAPYRFYVCFNENHLFGLVAMAAKIFHRLIIMGKIEKMAFNTKPFQLF